jgi:hypothetical protein
MIQAADEVSYLRDENRQDGSTKQAEPSRLEFAIEPDDVRGSRLSRASQAF